MIVLTTVFLVTLPFWESLLTTFLTSSMLWLQWPNWGRFLHAALPFKLLLGQMAWKFVAFLLGKAYGDLRQRLVELECQMWEDCMPLTILEGRMATDNDKMAMSQGEKEEDHFYDAREDSEDGEQIESDGQTFFDAEEDIESSTDEEEDIFFDAKDDFDDLEVFSEDECLPKSID